MSEGTKALRAVKQWDAMGRVLARGGVDLAALGDDSLRITAAKPATRVRLGLRHRAAHAQLVLELRVDFSGAPGAAIELDGAVHRQSAAIEGVATNAWSGVEFGGKYVELRLIHECVPKLMDAVYARSDFLPRLPALAEVARIVGLESGVDANLGAAQRIHFETHQHQDERVAFEAMGFVLSDGSGAVFTAEAEARWERRRGPDAGLPRGVAWRRDDATIVDDTASFGAEAGRIFRR